MSKIKSAVRNLRPLGQCAVITGASSGLGAEFARQLAAQGVFLVLTGRNEQALKALAAQIGSEDCVIIPADLSKTKECIDFYAKAKKYKPDILINNAGFGLYGSFTSASLSKELELIDVNIKAMHILFKLFLRDFVKQDRGYILNVGSVAGFMPGPLMAAYYSSKAYVIRQTQAVYTELRRAKSRVNVSVLCPGPVDTEFNRRAGITGFFKGITAKQCVSCALSGMRKRQLTITPTVKVTAIAVLSKVFPAKIGSYCAYLVQKGKQRIEE
ncbi:MAG: SDR family NAD(P)-dependent oxidoreductase [Ruminococcus sp.]|nr:SDR family NAD(P)-dependent oxidoreductase [Ruminococcus sp.]